MKKRNKIIIAVISGLVLISGIAACSHHRNPQARAEYAVEKISSKLELNDAQTIQLVKLKNEIMNVRQSMQSDRNSMFTEIDELPSQSTLDQPRVLQLLQSKIDTVNNKAPQIITAFAEFYDSLNPEQQLKIREKIQDHREHSHGWHH